MQFAALNSLQRFRDALCRRFVERRGHPPTNIVENPAKIGELQRHLHQERPVVFEGAGKFRERVKETRTKLLPTSRLRPGQGGIGGRRL